MLARLLAVLMIVSDVLSMHNPSVLVKTVEYAEATRQSELFCPHVTFTRGEATQYLTDTLNTSDVIDALTARALDIVSPDKLRQKAAGIGNGTFRVAITETFWPDDVLNATALDPSISFIMMRSRTPVDLLCMEAFAALGRYDAILPMWTDSAVYMQHAHAADVLEAHFGMPFIAADASLISTFTNKAMFSDWLREHDLGEYTPETYRSKHEARLPCLVKTLDAAFGMGIRLVQTQKALDAVVESIERLNQSYTISEALPGQVEPIVHFIAHRGDVLAFTCLLDKQESELYVAGKGHKPAYVPVNCKHIADISPTLDVVKAIARQSNYNGFGCLNFKFVPDAMPLDEIEAFLRGLSRDDGLHMMTQEQDRSARVLTGMGAIPKFFDMNARMCGTMMAQHTSQIGPMVRLYARALAE